MDNQPNKILAQASVQGCGQKEYKSTVAEMVKTWKRLMEE